MKYYPHFALIAMTAVPVVAGVQVAFAFLLNQGAGSMHGIENSGTDIKRITVLLLIFTVLLGLTSGLLILLLTKPVPLQGWLRSIYSVGLISLQAPLIYLIITVFSRNRRVATLLSILLIIFLVSVPVGLILIHPWNYIAFPSPFYWISWAWVIESPKESLIYGSIAVIITAIYSTLLFRKIKS